MKIKFKHLKYQDDATLAVTDLFEGLQTLRGDFTIKETKSDQLQIDGSTNTIGFGNKVNENISDLINYNLTENKKNYTFDSLSFAKEDKEQKEIVLDIEMETGTGKTFVFINTILALSEKHEGFRKFIIVVPSVAIREGVKKNLEITKEHFNNKYHKLNYSWFVYDSKRIEEIRNFGNSKDVKIMIINSDSFNKDKNIFNKEIEQLGDKASSIIKNCNPIVVIDEPQSSHSTAKSKETITSLNPLFVLRYSATFRNKLNCVYSLDSFKAYEQNIVKHISVIDYKIKDSTKPYITLIKTNPKNNNALISYKDINGKVKEGSIPANGGDVSEMQNADKNKYKNFVIEEIKYGKDNDEIIFKNGVHVTKNKPLLEVSDEQIKKTQIKETIRQHFENQEIYKKWGVKILTLFFIDRVANYREYDKDGNSTIGKYAKWFEEEFKRQASRDKFKNLFKNQDINTLASQIHNGYFSGDKKGLKDTKGNSQLDKDTFSLIMKDKEKLLSFDEPLSFIFSHSTLKEGWDNPNVFQICTLNETKSEIKKRQEIGRGLRLPVNQDGLRCEEKEIHELTIIANESYEEFSRKLQREWEEETGIKFNRFNAKSFSNWKLFDIEVGERNSIFIFNKLIEIKAIDKKGKPKKDFFDVIEEHNQKVGPRISILEGFEHEELIIDYFIDFVRSKPIPIINEREKKLLKIKDNFQSTEEFKIFKKLWKKISKKTYYQVEFNDESFEEESVKKLDEEIKNYIPLKARLQASKTQIETINQDGVSKKTKTLNTKGIHEQEKHGDYVGEIEKLTRIKRSSIVSILKKSKYCLEKISIDYWNVIKEISKIINIEKNNQINDSVVYEKELNKFIHTNFDDDDFIENMFEQTNISIRKANNGEDLTYDANEVIKFPLTYIDNHSLVELKYAKEMISDDDITLFVKLPERFKIETPVGKYGPDWAIVLDKGSFIIETKGTEDIDQLKEIETRKIKFANKHFEVIFAKDNKYKFIPTPQSDYQNTKDQINRMVSNENK